MKYKVGNIYYIPEGRYSNGRDKAGMNDAIGYGSLSKVELDTDSKCNIYHFNQVLLYPDLKIWHYKKCIGEDCLDAVNSTEVTKEEIDYHISKQEEFAVRKREFELSRGINVDGETGNIVRFNPNTEAVTGKHSELISKIYNLIVDAINNEGVEELKKKNTELINENTSLTKENIRLSKENAELQDKVELIKEALKL